MLDLPGVGRWIGVLDEFASKVSPGGTDLRSLVNITNRASNAKWPYSARAHAAVVVGKCWACWALDDRSVYGPSRFEGQSRRD